MQGLHSWANHGGVTTLWKLVQQSEATKSSAAGTRNAVDMLKILSHAQESNALSTEVFPAKLEIRQWEAKEEQRVH